MTKRVASVLAALAVAVPAAAFDPADPLHTPAGIDTTLPANHTRVIAALKEAMRRLDEAGVALDAPWRDVQYLERNGENVPIHGGHGTAGIYNASDDSEIRMGDWLDLVAARAGLPRPPRIPRAEAAGRIPAELLSFMGESRRLVNRRMKDALGIRLQYPTVYDGVPLMVPA